MRKLYSYTYQYQSSFKSSHVNVFYLQLYISLNTNELIERLFFQTLMSQFKCKRM